MTKEAEHARIAERARRLLKASDLWRDEGYLRKAEVGLRQSATLALLAYETLAGQVGQGENDV